MNSAAELNLPTSSAGSTGSESRTAHPHTGSGVTLVLALATLFVPFCWVISAAAPLMTYTTALALFGLPHVWAELGYVEGRFGPRLATRLVIGWSIFLGGIILVRLLTWMQMLSWSAGAPMELLLVGAMVALILPELWAKGPAQTAAGIVAGGAFVMGAVIVPAFMLVCLAVAHNATPVGFLAERLRGRDRILAMAWCACIFAILPIGLALGWGRNLAEWAGMYWPNETLLPAGELKDHLAVYVPKVWKDASWAADLFSAAVFLQCMHYVAVIRVLPALASVTLDPVGGCEPAPIASAQETRQKRSIFLVAGWRNPCFWLVFVWLATLFMQDFTQARWVYGFAAAIHAWIEIPLLLLALPGGPVAAEMD